MTIPRTSVVSAGEGEILVPAISGAVLEIERERRRIVVDERALEYSGSGR